MARRDRRVAPPVIQNQLAAPGLEGFQVGVDGRQIRAGFFPGDLHVAIEVERIEVPGRVVEDHVFEELRSKGVHQTLGGLIAGYPLRPTVRFGFAARRVARHHPLARRVARAVVEFFQRSDLRSGEATVAVLAFAEKHRRIETAGRRIFDNAVLHAVVRVARRQSCGLNCGQLAGRDIARGVPKRRLNVVDRLA